MLLFVSPTNNFCALKLESPHKLGLTHLSFFAYLVLRMLIDGDIYGAKKEMGQFYVQGRVFVSLIIDDLITS